MNNKELLDYINNNEILGENTLQDITSLIKEYPYFQTAHLLLTKNLFMTDKNKFEEVLGTTSAICADRRRLFYLIKDDKFKLFHKKATREENSDRTDEILDSYFTTFTIEEDGKASNVENDLIETSIISTDYLAYTGSEDKGTENETGPELKHQDIIDSFLEKAETNEIIIQPIQKETSKSTKIESEQGGGSFLTETLAKIYIKQKKYEQALTIIRQLSLNFPKKSAYFADQIRFLELLILNEKNKKQ